MKIENQARFSGRQTFTGAVLSLALPAGFAGSLKSSFRNWPWLSLVCLILVSLSGCSRPQANESHPAKASPSVPNIRSSADVVKVKTVSVVIPANGKADAIVMLSITPGFHVNANPPTFSYLIPTEVQHIADPDEPILMSKPVYPTALKKRFAFAEQPLAVYEGEVPIKLPLSVGRAAQAFQVVNKGQLSFPISIRVQACDQEQCFPPDTLHATIAVEVK